MRADPFLSPVAGAAALAMLAFSLAAGALLLHLNVSLQAPPAVDRYVDPVRQASLTRGMGWLNEALVDGAAAVRLPAPDCESRLGQDLYDCRRDRINQRLALADPPAHLGDSAPDADSLPAVLATTRWLLQYSGAPGNMRELLQRGEDAATQSRPDPFRLNGCVAAAGATDPCAGGPVAAARALLPHAAALVNSLTRYTAPARGQSPNVQMVHSVPGLATPITQGRHVKLALEPGMQQLAQTTAACFTGDAAACGRCAWCGSVPAVDMFEQARARALGLLVLDARSGAIEAVASAYSTCYYRQQLGQRAGALCPDLPNTQMARPGRLGNQALEQTAKPGSITKIVIALGLQQARSGAALSAAETAELPRILTQSRTLELIDLTMCKRQDFDPDCAQRRLLAVAGMAVALGWDSQADILGADQLPGLQAQRFSARLLSQPDGTGMVGPAKRVTLTRAALQACSRQQWRNCKGRDLVNLVAELFGTGEALASPLGVGNALLHLAAAANLQDRVAQAHLVASAQDNAGQPRAVHAALRPVLDSDRIRPVLLGLERTATRGTARSACLAAAAALPGGRLPCVAGVADGAALRIAGKTGTPVFSADQGDKKSLSLAQWRAQCAQAHRELSAHAKGHQRWYHWSNEVGKCNMAPTKWYAFLLGAPGSTGWDKVVVVLAERNWNQRTGLIDSPNDHGPNVAAEAGLSLANRLYYQAPPP